MSWYEIERLGDGITVVGEPMHAEAVKSYLVEGERDVAVIDTGLGVSDFRAMVALLSDRDPIVLQTHGHWDHIGGSHAFERVLIHPNEAYALRRGFPNRMYAPLFSPQRVKGRTLPDGFDLATAEIPPREPSGELSHGDVIDLGGREVEVFFTPGHSQGGVSLLDRQTGALFCGDAVNLGGMWLFLPRSDAEAFRSTIGLLAELAESGRVSAIYPAHGSIPLAPDDLIAMRDAFDEVWAGRERDRHVRWDIGFPERVPVDVHEFGRFSFLLGTDRYGGHRSQG